MKPDRYEVSTERKRPSGDLQPRGTQTGLSAAGLFCFGLPFAGMGTWAMLAGTKTIPIDPSNLHAPYWVLAVVGVVFAAGGGLLWGMGWRQAQEERRKRRLLASGQHEPALLDYAWDTRGFSPPRWSRAVKALASVAGLATFLSIFNWWAFCEPSSPWILKGIVGLFDLLLVYALWQTGLLVGRTIKFAPSRLEFTQFPLRPGETVVLRWQVPRGLHSITKGSITLRSVAEWYESSGSGKNRNRRLVQEQIWSGTQYFDAPAELHPNQCEELRFDVPTDAVSTSFSGDGRTFFWELVVDLDVAGLDFKETYLIPIYRADLA